MAFLRRANGGKELVLEYGLDMDQLAVIKVIESEEAA